MANYRSVKGGSIHPAKSYKATRSVLAGRPSGHARRAALNARPVYRGKSFKGYLRSGSATSNTRPGRVSMAMLGGTAAAVGFKLGPRGVALAAPVALGSALAVGYASSRIGTRRSTVRTAKQVAASRRNIQKAQMARSH